MVYCRVNIYSLFSSKRYFSSVKYSFRKCVCIVGSGPAGFYFAQHLMKKVPDVQIDMYEKLPVPFGLVRYGVAPDHPEVKNVINTFTKVASNENFRFVGNVTIGPDITFRDIRNAYHAVVLAYGCSEENRVNIDGEESLLSARRFVGWYNGLPEDRNLEVNLNSETVVIIGQGNVAIDVARILLSPIDALKKTDITEYSLEKLSRSRVRTVYLVGRRGPLHVAFTIKEFREMTKLPGVSTVFRKSSLDGLDLLLPSLPRPRKRLTELMMKTASTTQSGEKSFCPVFLRKPAKVILNNDKQMTGINFNINTIVDNLQGVVSTTSEEEQIDCGVGVISVGYKGTCLDPNVPFDEKRGIVVAKLAAGVYASGWIESGPVGVILSTMSNAFQQASQLADDIQTNQLDTSIRKPGFEEIEKILKEKGVRMVNFDDWKKIDQYEKEKGEQLGKPREKIVNIEEMLKIVEG